MKSGKSSLRQIFKKMKKNLFIVAITVAPTLLHAQLGGFINKTKNKIQQKIESSVEKKIDKGSADGEKKSTATTSKTTEVNSLSTEPTSMVKSFSRYDFVAGEKIIMAEDFEQDAIGELPLNWNTNGKGQVVTLENQKGKWMRLYPGATYFAGNKKDFGENFTFEFDLIIDGTVPKGTRFFPSFNFGLMAGGNNAPTDMALYREYMERNLFHISINPNVDEISKMQLIGRNQNNITFESEKQLAAQFKTSFHKVAHYAVQVQKQRLRFWVNEDKYFDMPRIVNLADPLNMLFFSVAAYFPYNDGNFGMYLSNLKIATGLPDSRHKLIEEGKFSTTGILFDVQSATIKPESYGVIKEIATVLGENPTVNIKVIGHTSSDGNDAANLELSKQRATAVKEMLAKEFNISAERITTEGKGETMPIADNKTKEGIAMNRRVEFIKA